MKLLGLEHDALLYRRRFGRVHRLYYEEIDRAQRQGGRLVVERFDGARLVLRVPTDPEAVAATLEGIVAGDAAALERVTDPAGLARELGAWIERPGFAATPFVRFLVNAAARVEASDLHLEPGAGGVMQVTLRRHGRLIPVGTLPARVGARVIGRLKVMGGVCVHLDDRIQEGRASLEAPGAGPAGAGPAAQGDVRLTFVPSVWGEAATVRLFDRLKGDARLVDLGFDAAQVATLSSLLERPGGLLVVAGPSGSGKTTTLYTLLRHRLATAEGGLRVVTAEDPVEYRLPGVVQLEADVARGNTVERLLESALRQDANLIAVGEVRGPSSARLALRAALTGHQVLTTLHAGSVGEALLRLLELGLPARLLTAAVTGVLAQRLVRRSGPEGAACSAGDGPACPAGAARRTAVAELLVMGPAVRRALVDDPTLDGLSAAARRDGLAAMDEPAERLAG